MAMTHVEELAWDFLVDNQATWPSDGEIAHCYIRFAFAGPMATKES